IIGQDPYHGEGQAHGLCFSVRKGVAIPPSLINIYKEIESEYGVKMPRHGDLTGWAEQGVLLLNATLTVQKALAGSHQRKGWEEFTDAIIRAVNEKREHVVFLLWGSYAQKKGALIDRKKHLVLEAPHPSPLSAHRGFLGCGHFKCANEYLAAHGLAPIDWQKI
ncbi:MAG: uracil-DNA glycosylase, partial [Alphaproteobacteria bacterium]|nr:uracil-DNA glycosylase [Alphaproteobacteria bacterium]